MEETALKNYSLPESYEALARSFGNTTEKVWAVIYGEIYCNLATDPDHISETGSRVFRWYEESLSKNGNQLSIDLTENAQASPNHPPFESQFETSFLFGALPSINVVPPLSIKTLIAIRKNQLSLWGQKKLPSTELVRRQQTVLAASHFDAYNYWLFKAARPEEFEGWVKEHQTEFQAWLDWLGKNKLVVKAPDFQRLYLLRSR